MPHSPNSRRRSAVYKRISIAVFSLAVLAFVLRTKPVEAVPNAVSTPVIVAQGSFSNQNRNIRNQTIYTPTQAGVYRLTVYATITTQDTNSTSMWEWSASWTDASGQQQSIYPLWKWGSELGQFFAFYTTNYFTPGGYSMSIQANARTAITQTMQRSGAPDNSAYSLYYVLERL